MTSKQRTSQKNDNSKSFDFMHCKDSKELAALLVAAGYQCPKDTWDLSAMRQYAKLQGVNFVPDGVVVAKETAASRIQNAWRKFMTEHLNELLARRKEDAARAKALAEQAKADAAANRAANKAAMEAARLERGDGVMSPGGRRVLRPAVCRIHVEEEPLPDRITIPPPNYAGTSAAGTAKPGALTDVAAILVAPTTTAGWGARETLASVPGQQRLDPPKVANTSPAAPSRYLTTRYQSPARSPSPGKNLGEIGGGVGGTRRTPSPHRLNVCITSPLASDYRDDDYNGNISARWLSPDSTAEEHDDITAFASLGGSDLRQEAAAGVGDSAGPAAVGASALPPPRVMYRPTNFNGFNGPTMMQGPASSTGVGDGTEDDARRRNSGVVLRFEDKFGTQLPGVPQGMLTDKRVSDRMHRDANHAVVTSPPALGSNSNGDSGAKGHPDLTEAAPHVSALVESHAHLDDRPPSLEPLQQPDEPTMRASKGTPEGPSLPSPSSPSPRLERLHHHSHNRRSRSSSPSADHAAATTTPASYDDFIEGLPSSRRRSSAAAANPALIAAAVEALSPRYREEVLTAEVRAFIAPPGEALDAWQLEQQGQEEQRQQQGAGVAHDRGCSNDHRVSSSPQRHRESAAHLGTNTKPNAKNRSSDVGVVGSGGGANLAKMHWPLSAAVARYPSPDVTRKILPVRPSSAPSKSRKPPVITSPLPGRKLTAAKSPANGEPAVGPASAGKPAAATKLVSSPYAPPASPSDVAARAGPETGWVDGKPPSWAELRKLREKERKARDQHAAMLEVQFASKSALRSGNNDKKGGSHGNVVSVPLLAPLTSSMPTSASRPRPASATRRGGPLSTPIFARVTSPGTSQQPQPQRSRSRSRNGRSSGPNDTKGSRHRSPAAPQQPLPRMTSALYESNSHRHGPKSSTGASGAPTQSLLSPTSPATANDNNPHSGSSGSNNNYGNDPFALELLRAEAIATNRTAVGAEAARLLAELQRAERRAKRRSER